MSSVMQWSPTRREFLGAVGFGSGVGTGSNPAAGVGNFSVGNATNVVPDHPFVPKAGVQWQIEVDESAIPLEQTDDALVTVTHDAVLAVEADGTERWRVEVEMEDSSDYPDVYVATDSIYVDNDRRIRALDPDDGAVRWRFEGDETASVNEITSERVVASTLEGIVALSTANGREQWRFEPENGGVWSWPHHDGDRFFVSTTEGLFYALAERDGSVLWQTQFPRQGENEYQTAYPHLSTVGVTSGIVVAQEGYDGPLYGLNSESGARLWTFEPTTETDSYGATIADGVVYVNDSPVLRAVSTADGTERWRVDLDRELSWSPRLLEDALYVGGENRVDAISTDGSERWQFVPGDDVGASVQGATAETVVVRSREALYALDKNSGRVQWRFRYPNESVWFPQIQDDRVYLGTESGTVYALSPPNSTPLYDAYRTATSPLGVATGGLLGTGALAGAYRRHKRANAPPPDPEAFEDFELVESVAENSHTELFDARTPAGERVALKRLADFDPDEFTDALETWTNLDFRGVLEVRRWGTDPEPWLAMEWVAGGSIAGWTEELTTADLCRIVADVAEIVHCAHREEVVHGRLVPGNVLFSEDSVRVADWRLAPEVRESPAWLTAPENERLSGSEQSSEGERSPRDDRSPATDMYQLGALADRLLSVERTSDLKAVLSTALATDPAERYDSALKFADMLRWAGRR